MSFEFDRHAGLILVRALIEGPLESTTLILAVDTGASHTLLSPEMLVTAGYDIAEGQRIEITTGSRVESATRIVLRKLSALGQERHGLRVVSHALPDRADIDGLLGLDFMRDMKLEIDFREGTISLH